MLQPEQLQQAAASKQVSQGVTAAAFIGPSTHTAHGCHSCCSSMHPRLGHCLLVGAPMHQSWWTTSVFIT